MNSKKIASLVTFFSCLLLFMFMETIFVFLQPKI